MTATGPSPQQARTQPAGMPWHPLRAFGILLLVLCAGLWIDCANPDLGRAPGQGGLASAEKTQRTPSLAARDAMRAVLSAERHREPASGGFGDAPGLLPPGPPRSGYTGGAGATLDAVRKAAVFGHQPAGFRPRGPPASFV